MNRLPATRFIEITGMDGAGKSTLAHELVGGIIGGGNNAYVREFHSWVRRTSTVLASKRGRHRATYIGHDAVEFAVAMELMDRSHQLRMLEDAPATFVLDPYIITSAAIAAVHRVTNLDAIIDVYFHAARPGLICYLDIDPEAAYARILGRSSSDNVTLRGGVSDLVVYREAFEQVLPRFADAGYPVLRLDACRPTTELAATVFEHLLQPAAD